jgi:hypothetical protein
MFYDVVWSDGMQEMYVTMENLMFQGRKKLANYDNS